MLYANLIKSSKNIIGPFSGSITKQGHPSFFLSSSSATKELRLIRGSTQSSLYIEKLRSIRKVTKLGGNYHLKWLTCSLLLLFIYLYINYYAMIDWSEMREDEIWGKENREENGFFACLVRLERDRKENGAAGVSFQTEPTIFFSSNLRRK